MVISPASVFSALGTVSAAAEYGAEKNNPAARRPAIPNLRIKFPVCFFVVCVLCNI